MPDGGSLLFIFFGLPITLLAAVIACPFLSRSLREAGHPVLANVCIATGVIAVVAVAAFVIVLGDFYASLFRSWSPSLL